MSDAAATLRELAEQARRKNLPRRHELVAAALGIGAEALENVTTFVNKKGEANTYDAPQYQAANKAVEIAASLALKAEQPEVTPDGEAAVDLEGFVQQVQASGMAGVLMTKLAEAMGKGAKA